MSQVIRISTSKSITSKAEAMEANQVMPILLLIDPLYSYMEKLILPLAMVLHNTQLKQVLEIVFNILSLRDTRKVSFISQLGEMVTLRQVNLIIIATILLTLQDHLF